VGIFLPWIEIPPMALEMILSGLQPGRKENEKPVEILKQAVSVLAQQKRLCQRLENDESRSEVSAFAFRKGVCDNPHKFISVFDAESPSDFISFLSQHTPVKNRFEIIKKITTSSRF
jgi:hypothetical protein